MLHPVWSGSVEKYSLTVFIVMYVAIHIVVKVDLFYWVNKEAN